MNDPTPYLHRVPTTSELLGCGNSKTYELIAAGELEAVKIGRSTLITDESIRAYIKRLKAEARERGPLVNENTDRARAIRLERLAEKKNARG